MTFEEFLGTTNLPGTAKAQLPSVLSDKTKRELLKRSDAEEIISSSIDGINHGAVESVEVQIRKRLRSIEEMGNGRA